MPKITGTFCERSVAPKSTFDPRSFRWKASGTSWVLVGCPRGRWQAREKRCAVGLRAVKVLARTTSRCTVGKRVTKPLSGVDDYGHWGPAVATVRCAGGRRTLGAVGAKKWVVYSTDRKNPARWESKAVMPISSTTTLLIFPDGFSPPEDPNHPMTLVWRGDAVSATDGIQIARLRGVS
jgi:hypothetical protein